MRARIIRLLLIACGLLVGLAGATQVIAAGFGYDPRLGLEIARQHGIALYWPFAAAYWALTPLYRNGPQIFERAEFAFGLAMVASVLLGLLVRGRPTVGAL